MRARQTAYGHGRCVRVCVCVPTRRSQIVSGSYTSAASRRWRGPRGETERKEEVEEDDKRRSSILSPHTYLSPQALSPAISPLTATWSKHARVCVQRYEHTIRRECCDIGCGS